MDLQKELEAMGGPAAITRGEMIHLVLTLCRKFETAFAKLIDGGKGGAPGLGQGGGEGPRLVARLEGRRSIRHSHLGTQPASRTYPHTSLPPSLPPSLPTHPSLQAASSS